MRDRLRTVATVGIAALSAGLVVAALALTGGPVHARQEYRDNIRMRDLREIARHVGCAVEGSTGPLPASPEAVAGCGNPPRMLDPYTGQPYRYEVLDLRTVRLCAGFELPPDPHQQGANESIGADPDCRDLRVWRPDAVLDASPNADG